MKGAPLNEQAAALLRAAAGYVRKGHVRHANARKANGALCDPESPQAVCWCAQGALLAGLPDIGLRHPYLDPTRTYSEVEADQIIETRHELLRAAAKALREVADIALALEGHKSGIPLWNDEIVEDGAEVAGSMMAAAEKLEAAA